MSTDTEREIERESTSDEGRNVSRAGTGRERATVFKSKTGVAVVEATVARLTGGGKFVVQPIGGEAGVEVGDQVIIFILDKKLLGRSAAARDPDQGTHLIGAISADHAWRVNRTGDSARTGRSIPHNSTRRLRPGGKGSCGVLDGHRQDIGSGVLGALRALVRVRLRAEHLEFRTAKDQRR